MEQKVRNVSRRACLSCRERKIKCDGVQICKNCKSLGQECIFVPSHRGGRRRRKTTTANRETEPTSERPESQEIANNLDHAGSSIDIPASGSGEHKVENTKEYSIESSEDLYQATVGNTIDRIPDPMIKGKDRLQSLTNPAVVAPASSSSGSFSREQNQHFRHHKLVSPVLQLSQGTGVLSQHDQYGSRGHPYQLSGAQRRTPTQYIGTGRHMSPYDGPVDRTMTPSAALPILQPSIPMYNNSPPPFKFNLPGISNPTLAITSSGESRNYSETSSRGGFVSGQKGPNEELLESLPSILKSINDQLGSLQQQIDEIKESWPSRSNKESTAQQSAICGYVEQNPSRTESFVPQLAKIGGYANRFFVNISASDFDLEALDLPPLKILIDFIDAYYSYIHSACPFLLPEAFFFKEFQLDRDVALLHAMLALSCRISSINGVREARVSIYDILSTSQTQFLDPSYWISRCEKWLNEDLDPLKRLQSYMLLVVGFVNDCHYARASQFLGSIYNLIEQYGLHLLDTKTEDSVRENISQMLKSELAKESFRRVCFLALECSWFLCIYVQSSLIIPPLHEYVQMPCFDYLYESGLENVARKGSFFLSEFKRALDHPTQFSLKSVDRVDTTGESNLQQHTFPPFNFQIAGAEIMYKIAMNKQLFSEPNFVSNIDQEIQSILNNMYPLESCSSTSHAVVLSAYQIIYTAVILLLQGFIRDFLVFEVQWSHNGEYFFREHAANKAKENIASMSRYSRAAFDKIMDAVRANIEVLRKFMAILNGKLPFQPIPYQRLSLILSIALIASYVLTNQQESRASIKMLLNDTQESSSTSLQSTTGTTSLSTYQSQSPLSSASFGTGERDFAPANTLSSEYSSAKPVIAVELNTGKLSKKPTDPLTRQDLDLCLSSLHYCSKIWFVARREYDESIALISRMEQLGV
ncbi:hypothetical protein V1511DRAFT_15376 [Dipodascopsis uninucleata]